MTPQPFSIDTLLERAATEDASDLHLTAGSPPLLRMRGRLSPMADFEPFSAEETRELLYRILSTEQQKRLEIDRQIDFSYSVPGIARFRVNVYFQRDSLAAAFRLVPRLIKSAEELGLPEVLLQLAAEPRGLVLVTGPTGSGKSTTLATMIDKINATRPLHIVTIEDPIEFLHQHKTAVVNQREVGADAKGFAEALRGALRQDPDVILVGEMRDLETISTALTAAETGHLVLATLHTQSAPSTIDRVIDVFPAAQQGQVRMQLAASLQGIVTQTLLPTADGRTRVPALEILLPDDAVRNLIRQGKTEQIYSIMQTNTGRGMQTMEQSLADLVLRRVISQETAFNVTSRREEFESLLARSGVAPRT
ncbi:MAG TPA: type IV pilus twitching motility protein PilT, partial [Candidatus Dormibacteraeota bacterium]|nr:type IV pilus twitching motility protein PilT [Candidatus Dormibacteraeota bacterium]